MLKDGPPFHVDTEAVIKARQKNRFLENWRSIGSRRLLVYFKVAAFKVTTLLRDDFLDRQPN